jgi:hypothetical protein
MTTLMAAIARACQTLAGIALLAAAYDLATAAPLRSPTLGLTAATVLAGTGAWIRRTEQPDTNQPTDTKEPGL